MVRVESPNASTMQKHFASVSRRLNPRLRAITGRRLAVRSSCATDGKSADANSPPPNGLLYAIRNAIPSRVNLQNSLTLNATEFVNVQRGRILAAAVKQRRARFMFVRALIVFV